MHFSSFVQPSTMTNDMNLFSSNQYVNHSGPYPAGALAGPSSGAESLGRAYGMCNSHAKRCDRFVASREGYGGAGMPGWIEKPNKRGKLPTFDLGLTPLSPHIPMAEVLSTARIG
jgi:hypothetical protein